MEKDDFDGFDSPSPFYELDVPSGEHLVISKEVTEVGVPFDAISPPGSEEPLIFGVNGEITDIFMPPPAAESDPPQ